MSRFADETRDSGHAVRWGACRETEGAPAYWPWTQVLRAIPAPATGHDPVLRPLLHPEEASVQPDRFLLFDAVTNALAECARVDGLVLVLDDLHRADEASLALLRFVTACLHTAPLLLIGTYRDTELSTDGPLHRLVVDFAGGDIFELVELHGLDTDETAALAAREGTALSSAEVVALHERTGGNPFFVTELIRLAAHGGAGVPGTVQAALRARLGVLPDETRQLLLVAAVAGRDLDPQLLAAASGRSEHDIHAMLAEAVAGRIVEPHPRGQGSTASATRWCRRRCTAGWMRPSAVGCTGRSPPGWTIWSAPTRAPPRMSPTMPRMRSRTRPVGNAHACSPSGPAHSPRVGWPTRMRSCGTPRRSPSAKQRTTVASSCCWVPVAVQDDVETRRSPAARSSRLGPPSEQECPGGLVAAALGLGEVVVSAGTVDDGLIRMLERTLVVLGEADPRGSARLTARLAMELPVLEPGAGPTP